MKSDPGAVKLKPFAAALILFFAGVAVFSQTPEPFSQNVSPLGAPTGAVNDYAGVIDAATKQRLEARLKEFKENNDPPVELAVAVVRTTGERDIFDYSLAVARGWGIGSKETDNPGALLFVAIDDRKYFTHVSKDLEDELPDGLVGSLQRQYLVPEFKKGNFAKGIEDTIEAYIRTIEARRSGVAVTPTPKQAGRTADGRSWSSVFCCLIVIGFILLIIWSNRGGGKSGKGGGGWGGGGFGGAAGALPWIILGSGLGSGGSSSGGSDWGGGGGSDWGGFGGGGDFGGGGAGGDW